MSVIQPMSKRLSEACTAHEFTAIERNDCALSGKSVQTGPSGLPAVCRQTYPRVRRLVYNLAYWMTLGFDGLAEPPPHRVR